MTAQEILTTTKKLKVSLWSEGDKLKYKAPEGVLTDEMRANIRRLKPELLDLLESATAHRWRDEAPDVAELSAIAPNVLPQLTPDESAAALLARYRRGGAVLTLERVDHDGARKLALGVELTARVASEKRARAFQRITNHGLELVRALELESAPIIDDGAAMLTPQTWPPTKTAETTQ
jgi:hypothetical protein